MRKKIKVIGGSFLFISCIPTFAVTVTTTFQSTIMVSPQCTLATANLNFGSYNPLSAANVDATTTLNVTCTLNTPYTIALNAGNTGTFANRKMVSGANALNYNLYTTNARTTIWGDGTSGTNTVAGTGTGTLTAVTHTVFGRIAGNQSTVPPSTSYSDTITVTVSF